MKYNIDSIVDNGIHKDKSIKDILNEDRKYIFTMIKNGDEFDDKVLERAGIKKKISNLKVVYDTIFTKTATTMPVLPVKDTKAKSKSLLFDEDEDIFESKGIKETDVIIRGSLIDELDVLLSNKNINGDIEEMENLL